MVMFSLADLRCDEETDEVGADEPYVLLTAVDLTSSVAVGGFPVPLPTCEVVLYGPFNDVDEDERRAATFSPFSAGRITKPDDAMFVVSLMENDNGDANALRGIVKGGAVSSLFGSMALSRAERVQRLIADVDSAMGVPTGAPNFDDKVGVQELSFTADELTRARAGELVSRGMSIAGDGGRYSLRVAATPDIWGAIREKWIGLGAHSGPVGVPRGVETPTFDGAGRATPFAGGTISWHPNTGAHAVWGEINARWLAIGREQFGYPITDESDANGGGRYNDFKAIHLGGTPIASIYWTPQTGAREVYGAIRDAWLRSDGSGGRLGFPVDVEHDSEGGRVQNFQRGSIRWTPAGGAVIR